MNHLPIGINFDGVLVHDGLPTPHPQTRFAWIKRAGVFDYIEKNIDPTEDFTPYFNWVEKYDLPIGVFGGIFCAGQDDDRMRAGLRTGAELGAEVFNIQLYARHASGKPITNQQVADWYLDAMDVGTAVGCLPSLEVHVDMWSEQFDRVAEVANLLAPSNTPLRLTLDHSHLVFKTGHAAELELSGMGDRVAASHDWLLPDGAQFYAQQWLKNGWVAHAHTRSVGVGIMHNASMNRKRHQPGRAIQYPLLPPQPGQFHTTWREDALTPWKTAVTDMLAHMAAHPDRAPTRVTCEFIPFPDYGGGHRYSIWDNNIACAEWLQAEWSKL